MLAGVTLGLAVAAFLFAMAALFVALVALGVVQKSRERTDAVSEDITALHAHRVRIDHNVSSIVRHLQAHPHPIVVAKEPGRPQ